jgi:Amt family ammonium transporter
MNPRIRPLLYGLLALAIGSMVFAIFAPTVVEASDPPTNSALFRQHNKKITNCY